MSVEIFNIFYVNIYSALLLTVLLIIIYIKKDIYDFSGRIFKYMIMLNIFLSVAEASTLLVDGVDNYLARIIHYSLMFSVFLLTPIIGFLWAIYLDYKIFKTKDRIKHYFVYLIPFIIGFILLIVNFFVPVLFSISADNIYTREPMIMVNFSMLFMLLAYITYLVIANRRRVDEYLITGALVFMIFPAVGGIIQMSFYGVATIYSMFSMGIFSTYIALETIGSSRDNLTGLFTRVKSSEYINELIHKQSDFGVIMIDIDDFKRLNDLHGHNEGDKFLKVFGGVLTRVFTKEAIISRFGGDEFIIVKNKFKSEDLEFYKKSIYREFKNIPNELYDNFKFSIGCSVFSGDSLKTEEELIVEADNNMYINKADNKNYKRRRSDR